MKGSYHPEQIFKAHMNNAHFTKGRPPGADQRYGEEDSISHSTLFFDDINS